MVGAAKTVLAGGFCLAVEILTNFEVFEVLAVARHGGLLHLTNINQTLYYDHHTTYINLLSYYIEDKLE